MHSHHQVGCSRLIADLEKRLKLKRHGSRFARLANLLSFNLSIETPHNPSVILPS